MAYTPPPGAALEDFARLELKNAVIAGIQGAARGTGKYLTDLARVLGEGPSRAARRQAHLTIALAAQKSVLASYAQTVTARKKVPSYRQGDRYSGGVLRRALGARQMFDVDARGISFANAEFLDSEAAQWARLNAGAAPAGQGSRRRFEVRFSGLVVASLGIDMVPSEGFRIPAGVWINAAGEQVGPGSEPAGFYVSSAARLGAGPRRGAEGGRIRFQEPRVTAGIEARNFLDAGARTIADELGPTYQEMYKDLVKRGVGTVRPQKIRATVSEHRIQVTL